VVMPAVLAIAPAIGVVLFPLQPQQPQRDVATTFHLPVHRPPVRHGAGAGPAQPWPEGTAVPRRATSSMSSGRGQDRPAPAAQGGPRAQKDATYAEDQRGPAAEGRGVERQGDRLQHRVSAYNRARVPRAEGWARQKQSRAIMMACLRR
jgi:hypothetical protein